MLHLPIILYIRDGSMYIRDGVVKTNFLYIRFALKKGTKKDNYVMPEQLMHCKYGRIWHIISKVLPKEEQLCRHRNTRKI